MIKVITTTPMEAEMYAFNSKINNAIDSVGGMMNDLTVDQNVELDILLTVLDPDTPEEFGLAFGGSTLSLEFYDKRIDIVDFNADSGDETVLETFEPQEINKATTCLYNLIA